MKTEQIAVTVAVSVASILLAEYIKRQVFP